MTESKNRRPSQKSSSSSQNLVNNTKDNNKNVQKPTVQIVDMNTDGVYNAAGDKGVSRAKVAKGPHSVIRKNKFENVDVDAKNNKENLAAMPEESLRPSWRQIQ